MTQPLLCPLDKTSMRRWLYVPGDRRRPSEKTPYQLYWCDKCEYGVLHPCANQHEDTLRFYDVEDYPYYTHLDEPTKSNNIEKITFLDKLLLHLAWRFDKGTEISGSMIDRLINGKGTICEIGCGAGKLLLACRELGHSVWGIEPDPKARAVALSKGLQVEDGTAENLPSQLQKAYFDVIIMRHVLEHCLDPMLALANLKGLLKQGGVFICEVPNNGSIGAQWAGDSWSHLGVPRHVNFFTEKSLVAYIQRAGLEIISTQFCGYSRQFTRKNIQLEQRAYDFFILRNGHDFLPVRPSTWTRWIMLAFSAMASASRKYDSVFVVSRLPVS